MSDLLTSRNHKMYAHATTIGQYLKLGPANEVSFLDIWASAHLGIWEFGHLSHLDIWARVAQMALVPH